MRRESVERVVPVDSQHKRIDVLADSAGEVRKRLAPPQADFVPRQVETRAAELRDAALEAHASPQTWFLEHESDDAPRQAVHWDALRLRGLQPYRLSEQVRQFVGREVNQVEKMLHGE